MPPTRLQRAVGALLGVHAGDALGATFEFDSWRSIRARYPDGLRAIVGGGHFGWTPGHATDDTDLTRAVLLAYRDRAAAAAGGEPSGFDVARAAGQHMLDWVDGRDWPDRRPGSSPPDIGGATATGLRRLRAAGGNPERAGAGQDQAGNGSLMRCVPTALFAADAGALERESARISAITHDDARCTVACAAYNAVVRALLDGAEPARAVDEGLAVAARLEGGGTKPVREAMEKGRQLKVRDLAETGPGPLLPGRASGYVLESLAIAVSAVLDPRSLEDVLVDVVRIGSDTDTNAAIAGGLLGARDGVDGIPRGWVKTLQFADEFTEIATSLMAAG